MTHGGQVGFHKSLKMWFKRGSRLLPGREVGKRNVVFVAVKAGASDYYRGWVPTCAINENSKKVKAICVQNVTRDIVEWGDVFIWLKPAHTDHGALAAATLAKQSKKPVLIDMDDNVEMVPKTNPAEKKITQGVVLDNFRTWITYCDGVVTTNGTLCGYYEDKFGKKTWLVPNGLLLSQMPQQPRHDFNDGRVRLVWQGGQSHFDDLKMVAGAVRRVRETLGRGVKVSIMGFDGVMYRRRQRVRIDGAKKKKVEDVIKVMDAGIECDESFEPMVLDDYYAFLRKKSFDIGICPLIDNEFNRCKSNLKWLDYTWAGIAVVASDVGPYRQTMEPHRDAVLVPNTEDAWVEAIVQVARCKDLRQKLVANAWEHVKTYYDAAAIVPKWEKVVWDARSNYSGVRAFFGGMFESIKSRFVKPAK